MNNALRIARKTKGKTMAELHKETGVSPSTISQIETGKTMGSIKVFKKLASALDCGWRELLED